MNLDNFWSGVVATLLAEIVLLLIIYVMEVRRRRVERRRSIGVAFSRVAMEIRIARDDGLFAAMWAGEHNEDTRAYLSRFRDGLMQIVAAAASSDRAAASWMLLELQFAAVEPFLYFEATGVPKRKQLASEAWCASYGPGPAGGEPVEIPDPADVSDWIRRILPGTGKNMKYYADRFIPSRRKHVEDGNHFPAHFVGLEIVGWPEERWARRAERTWEDRFRYAE